MLLPFLRLRLPAREPDAVRSMLSKLSKGASVGLVELLGQDDFVLIRAHADRYSFTILGSDSSVEVIEHDGPQAVRVWREDPPEDVANVRVAAAAHFGGIALDPSSWSYLYTEHGWFIFRPHRQTWLPRVKRRVFGTEKGEITVLHHRQNDLDEGELAEYVLEKQDVIWRMSLIIRLKPDGEMEGSLNEAPHRVEEVGF
jgi:hypothetical protein